MERKGQFHTVWFRLLLLTMGIGVTQVPYTVAAVSPQAPAATYHLDEHWPEVPPGEQFGTIPGVAVAANGDVYAFRRNDGNILHFDASGKFLGEWNTGATLGHTIRIDGDGFLWLSDFHGNEVKKFRTDGTLVMTIGAPEKPFNGPDILHGPDDVLVTANGDFYISDGYWNSRIVKFDKDGKFLKILGNGPGRAPGQLGLPHNVVQDSEGRILVSDRCDRPRGPDDERRVNPGCTDLRIQFFDVDGRLLDHHLDVTPTGLGMTIAGDLLYATTTASSGKGTEVVILNTRTGKKIDSFPIVGAIHSLAVDKSGENIYLADMGPFDPGKRVGSKGGIRRYARKSGI
jgi:DNA-binding beta-propeller fold protein YncE